MTSSSRAPAATKPTTGLNSSALNTPNTGPHCTPALGCPAGASSWLAMPTPMIEPISACEDEFGMPNAQVTRFQTMAAISSEKIIE